MGVKYPRGIQVEGKLTFFDKQGEFNGSLTDEGVVIKGGIDAFKVGGLEITSLNEYNGKRRATLDIELTKTTQEVLVDGILRFYTIELQVYINVDLQQKFLEFNICVKLTDALVFTLQGTVKANTSKSLENTVVHFKGHLQASILQSVKEGIINGINALEDQVKSAIDNEETKITELQEILAKQERELEELRRQSAAELTRKRRDIKKENETLQRLYNQIDKYEKRYQEAKRNKESKDTEIEEQMKKRDKIQAQLEDKKREMRQEYDGKIKKLRSEQQYYESERDRLIQKKEASWGDDLRKGAAAERNWKWWTGKSPDPLYLLCLDGIRVLTRKLQMVRGGEKEI